MDDAPSRPLDRPRSWLTTAVTVFVVLAVAIVVSAWFGLLSSTVR